MSASADLQAAIVELLQAPGALRVNVPVRGRVPLDYENDLLASADKKGGLCIYVMPVLPKRASSMQSAPFVFFDAAEVIVRIIEQPRSNNFGADAYDLLDDVALALHWQPKVTGTLLGQIVRNPLQLADPPTRIQEGVLEETKDFIRIMDVMFEATFGFAATS